MDGAQPRPRRSLFGYGKRSVDQFIQERDWLLREREHRLAEAEARVAALQDELREREQAIDQLKRELDSIGLEPQESSQDYATRLTASLMTEELQRVLGAAQDAATRIIERADLTTKGRLREAEQLWRDVEAQLARLVSWHEVVTPVSESTRSGIANAQSEIEDVPERIRQALVPMADAIADVQARIAELVDAASPPALARPEGIEEQAEGEDENASDETPDIEEGGEGGDEATVRFRSDDLPPDGADEEEPPPPDEPASPEPASSTPPGVSTREDQRGSREDWSWHERAAQASHNGPPAPPNPTAPAAGDIRAEGEAGIAPESPEFTPSGGEHLSVAFRPGRRRAWFVERNLRAAPVT
ncbi:MAG: hypothetical protein ACJ77A_19290 [Actinomycetota bacterium]